MGNSKFFIVETTNKGEWETNHGYHLVKARDIDEARSITKDNIPDQIIQTVEINEFLSNEDIDFPISWIHVKGKMRTIINSQEM